MPLGKAKCQMFHSDAIRWLFFISISFTAETAKMSCDKQYVVFRLDKADQSCLSISTMSWNFLSFRVSNPRFLSLAQNDLPGFAPFQTSSIILDPPLNTRARRFPAASIHCRRKSICDWFLISSEWSFLIWWLYHCFETRTLFIEKTGITRKDVMQYTRVVSVYVLYFLIFLISY